MIPDHLNFAYLKRRVSIVTVLNTKAGMTPLKKRVLSASVCWAKNFLKRSVRGRVAGFAASTLPCRIEAR
jgi:hypothetical protein